MILLSFSVDKANILDKGFNKKNKLLKIITGKLTMLAIFIGAAYWFLAPWMNSLGFDMSSFISKFIMLEHKHTWMWLTTWAVIVILAAVAQSELIDRADAGEEIKKYIQIQKAILNNIPDIAWLKDAESRFIAVNDAFGKTCGLGPKQLAGKTDLDIWPEDLAKRYRDDDREVMATGKRKQIEEPLVDKEGVRKWIETIKTPIYNEKSEVIGTVGIARDITDHRMLENELQSHREHLEKMVNERTAEITTAIDFLKEEIDSRKKTEETLKESEANLRRLHGIKVLGELAAGVAHEVRNPLHALMSVAEALHQEVKDNPHVDIYLFHIRTQVERLSTLMKDLLELGKPVEPSKMHRESLLEICLASLDIWKHSPSRQGREVSLVGPPESSDIFVMADSQRLQQVFLNLLDNSAHHSPKDSEIRIIIQGPAEDTVIVRVVDSGSGIPEEVLPRIFEPFFSTRKGGSGLGLSIVSNIVESHGGSIVVRNNYPQQGCTVEMRLPLASGEKA